MVLCDVMQLGGMQPFLGLKSGHNKRAGVACGLSKKKKEMETNGYNGYIQIWHGINI